MKEEIQNIIKAIWNNSNIVVHEAAGAFLVEVVSDQINSEDLSDDYQKFSNAFNNWNSGKQPNEVIVFHKVYLYTTNGDQFKYDGTLHTAVMSSLGNVGGVTTLSANDAYVAIAEVDAQAHLYGGAHPTKMRMVSSPTEDGSFNISEGVKYNQIEFQGENYRIGNLKRSKHGSDIWNVEVFEKLSHF